MKRALQFANRVTKELLRDPLNLGFGLGFPVVLLLLLTAIQANIPSSANTPNVFELQNLAPGIAVFGLTFLTLFSATLIAKDRESAFLHRLYTSPLTATDFIIGYTLPVLPIALVQSAVSYLLSLVLGLKPTVHILSALLFILPISLFFISLGLLFGSLLNVKQTGGICGALLTNLTAWLSGIWFDLELVGSTFQKFANLLPFVHAVELERALLRGAWGEILPHLLWVLGYTLLALALAIFFFLRQMKKN